MRRLIVVLALCALAVVGAAGAGGNPSGVLISDAHGKLHFFDLGTGELSVLHEFAEGGNFDIKHASPSELVIANLNQGRLDRFDLRTGSSSSLVPDGTVSAIGVAVAPSGTYYVTDHSGSVHAYDVRSGTLTLLADQGPEGEGFCSPDGIVLDRRGRVIFTDHCGRVYRITPSTGAIEVVATIEGAALNGVVLDRRGRLVVAAHDAPGGSAVYRIHPDTGAVETLFQGLPLRDPEDVAVDQHGNVYILDSDFTQSFGDFDPALYVLRADTGSLERLVGLSGDVVDLLLTPFTGPSDR